MTGRGTDHSRAGLSRLGEALRNAPNGGFLPRAGRAYLLLALTALFWGANTVFGRLAVGEVSPMLLVTVRWAGVLVLLAVFARAPLRLAWPVLRPRLLYIAIIGVLGFSAFNGFYYVAAHYTTAVNMGILQGSIPIFVLIGAFIAYRSRVAAAQIAGVVVTIAGVAIVASGGDLARLAGWQVNRG